MEYNLSTIEVKIQLKKKKETYGSSLMSRVIKVSNRAYLPHSSVTDYSINNYFTLDRKQQVLHAKHHFLYREAKNYTNEAMLRWK